MGHHLRREAFARRLPKAGRRYRAYRCRLSGSYRDVRGVDDSGLYVSASYGESQAFGEGLRAAGEDGLICDSLRHQGGVAICAYRPSKVLDVMQAEHFRHRGRDGKLDDPGDAASVRLKALPLLPRWERRKKARRYSVATPLPRVSDRVPVPRAGARIRAVPVPLGRREVGWRVARCRLAASRVLPVEEAVELFRRLPAAELAVVPGADHGAFFAVKAHLFQAAMLDFLSRQDVQVG